MINTSTDYTGRKVDLEIFQTENPVAVSKQLDLTMTTGDVSRKVAGIQKLAQRYLLTFFTAQGTVKFNVKYGSIFMPAVAGGLLQSRTAIVQYFSFANINVGQQLRFQDQSVEGLALPSDEKYAKSYLLDYAVDTSLSQLYLKVMLESLAGTTYTFILPVT